MDKTPIAICKTNGMQQKPVVASDGKDFLVVWHDLRNLNGWDIYGTTVSADGTVGTANGSLLIGEEHNQCFPDLIYAKDHYYMAWLDMRHYPEYRVFGSRVSRQGKMMDGTGKELIRTMTDKEMAAWKKAPFAPGKKGIGWHHFGKKGMDGMKQAGPPVLVCNDKQILVLCNEQVAKPSNIFYIRSMGIASGSPLSEQQTFSTLKIIDNTRLSVHWTQTALVPTPDGFMMATAPFTVAFGASGKNVWMASFIDKDGNPKGKKEIESIPIIFNESQQIPYGYRTYGLRHLVLDLTWNNNQALFVCEHHSQKPTPGNIDVWAMLIDKDGKRLTGKTLTTPVEPDIMKRKRPSLITPDGAKVGPAKIANGPDIQSAPATAAGPDGSFLVVWQAEGTETDSRIMARIINKTD
jgi:hypothetical protein